MTTQRPAILPLLLHVMDTICSPEALSFFAICLRNCPALQQRTEFEAGPEVPGETLEEPDRHSA